MSQKVWANRKKTLKSKHSLQQDANKRSSKVFDRMVQIHFTYFTLRHLSEIVKMHIVNSQWLLPLTTILRLSAESESTFLPKLKKCPQGVNELYCGHKNGTDLRGKGQNEDIKPTAMTTPQRHLKKRKTSQLCIKKLLLSTRSHY